MRWLSFERKGGGVINEGGRAFTFCWVDNRKLPNQFTNESSTSNAIVNGSECLIVRTRKLEECPIVCAIEFRGRFKGLGEENSARNS